MALEYVSRSLHIQRNYAFYLNVTWQFPTHCAPKRKPVPTAGKKEFNLLRQNGQIDFRFVILENLF